MGKVTLANHKTGELSEHESVEAAKERAGSPADPLEHFSIFDGDKRVLHVEGGELVGAGVKDEDED